jgi:hypothetical protein
MKLETNEIAVQKIQERMTEAVAQLMRGKSVILHLEDRNTLNGLHSTLGVLNLNEGWLKVLQPASGHEIIMTAHTVEAAVHLVQRAGLLETAPFPDLHFVSEKNELLRANGNGNPHLTHASLAVDVQPTHYVVLNSKSKSNDLGLESMIRQYYKLLKEHATLGMLSDFFPVNTLLANIRSRGDQPGESEIGFYASPVKGDERFKRADAGRIGSFLWQPKVKDPQ